MELIEAAKCARCGKEFHDPYCFFGHALDCKAAPEISEAMVEAARWKAPLCDRHLRSIAGLEATTEKFAAVATLTLECDDCVRNRLHAALEARKEGV